MWSVPDQQCRQAIVNVGFRAVGSNSWNSALSSKPDMSVLALVYLESAFPASIWLRTYAKAALVAVNCCSNTAVSRST